MSVFFNYKLICWTYPVTLVSGECHITPLMTLRWRHNGRNGISNHQPHGWLLNCLFRHRSKKTSKLRVTGLCVGNSPGTGEFPAQRATHAENVSILWHHHDKSRLVHGAIRQQVITWEPIFTQIYVPYGFTRHQWVNWLCWRLVALRAFSDTSEDKTGLCLTGKIWYLQHNCVGDTIVYH